MTLTESLEGFRDLTKDEIGAVAGAFAFHPIGPSPRPHPIHGPVPIDPHPLPINPGGPIIVTPLSAWTTSCLRKAPHTH